MKKKLFSSLVIIMIFILITILTISNKLESDGNLSIGFPFKFYIKYGGKRDILLDSNFDIKFFVFDIFILLLSILTFEILKKRNKNSS